MVTKPPKPSASPLLGGHPALDLLDTLVAPTAGKLTDFLETSEGLLAWIRHARPQDAALADVLAEAPDLDALTARVRALRAWFLGFLERHGGRPLGPEAAAELGPLNAVLAEDESHLRVQLDGGAGEALRVSRLDPSGTLLQALAYAIVDLLTTKEWGRVRVCEGPDCRIWFLDATKAGNRRWCSMAVCGNRHKAALHRARSRGHGR